jgi:hypothetical protein
LREDTYHVICKLTANYCLKFFSSVCYLTHILLVVECIVSCHEASVLCKCIRESIMPHMSLQVGQGISQLQDVLCTVICVCIMELRFGMVYE